MNIFIAQAVGRTLDYEHVQCLLRLMTANVDAQIEYCGSNNDALVSRSRSLAATKFLASDADVLVSIDSDVIFSPEDVMTIAQAAMTKDIVSGAYICRNDAKPALALWPMDGVAMTFDGQQDALVPIKWATTGFLAIHRRVFERLAARKDMHRCHVDTLNFIPFYAPFQHEDPDKGWLYLSEDYALCERAREEGFSVWLDTNVRLGHIGSKVYRLEDLLMSRIPAQPLRVTRHGNGFEVMTPDLDPEATGLPLERSAA